MHQPKFFAWSPVWEVPPHIVNGEVGDAVHDVEELLHHHDDWNCSSLLNFQVDDVQSWLSLHSPRSPNINWQSLPQWVSEESDCEVQQNVELSSESALL